MKINKIILISIAIIILSALSVSAAQITYQDTIVYSEQSSNGSIMIDADDAAKIFGSDLEFENDSAFFIKDALYAQFTADYDRMLTGACHDGKNDGYREFYREFSLPASPFISDGRFFVPLERLCEFFHYNMESDGENITISQPPKSDNMYIYSSWADNGHMYKIDEYGQNRQILSYDDCFLDSGNSNGFLYYDGYIYYSVRGENENCLFRMKPDGSDSRQLTFLTTEPIYEMQGAEKTNRDSLTIKNNKLFYVSESTSPDGKRNCIYSLDMTTLENTLIYDKPTQYTALSGDYLIFKSNDIMYKMNIYTNAVETVTENLYNTKIFYNGNHIYLSEHKKYFLYDLESGEKTPLPFVYIYNVTNGYILGSDKNLHFSISDEYGENFKVLNDRVIKADLYGWLAEIYNGKVYYNIENRFIYDYTIREITSLEDIPYEEGKIARLYKSGDKLVMRDGVEYPDNKEYGIFSVNLDGTENRCLYTASSTNFFSLSGNILKFSDSGAEKRLDLDTGIISSVNYDYIFPSIDDPIPIPGDNAKYKVLINTAQ